MTQEKEPELRSSYELAMERLAAKGEREVKLTEKQKAAIAEIESQTKAKTAEIEIMFAERLAEARAGGEPEKIREVEEERIREIERTRSRGEDEKKKVRQG